MATKRSNDDDSCEVEEIFKRQRGDDKLPALNETEDPPFEASKMSPFKFSIQNPNSSYNVSGEMARAEHKFIQGEVQESGSDLEEILLVLPNAPSAIPINGEVIIHSCEDVPTGTKLETGIDKQYTNKVNLDDCIIYYTAGIAMQNLILGGTGFTCQAYVAGYRVTFDHLAVRMGAGGVSFWITSGGKLGKIRIVPVGKKTNCLSWMRDGQFLNLCCK